MVRKSFMLIAGEPSGDLLGAELVSHLRARITDFEAAPTPDQQPLHASLEPVFFGAGGPQMRAAGMELVLDMTEHSVVGLWEVIKRYAHFRRVFSQLTALAKRREPHAIICIDFSGFNLRFAQAIRRHVRSLRGTFGNWEPRMIQYVSPQVWASRPERARRLAADCDLLLSILPFEKDWYAQRVPSLRVEFIGHPIVDRHAGLALPPTQHDFNPQAPHVLLLPGSRLSELKRHLAVLLPALAKLRAAKSALQAAMVLPKPSLVECARAFGLPGDLKVICGTVSTELARADLAIGSTGTVMLECAYFGVPTVALYKTSALTYAIARQLVQVRFLAMPNILANDEVYPEFIQGAATADNIARAALELLDNPQRRAQVQSSLVNVVQALGPPGASARAADCIVDLVENRPRPLRAALA